MREIDKESTEKKTKTQNLAWLYRRASVSSQRRIGQNETAFLSLNHEQGQISINLIIRVLR